MGGALGGGRGGGRLFLSSPSGVLRYLGVLGGVDNVGGGRDGGVGGEGDDSVFE